ncbi:MAG: M3 family oligoendopeptidase [Brevefilum sp.]|nr:M3 family oligoendopeptidase [Brevefilum sp.]MDT8382403.1 M3 family oligoendopeptidase [Brevefilum sp.]MDW7754033.1 M3 family oligoendopeptidase [Brevefilum sp.]
MPGTPPRWDLSNVYPGLESSALQKDIEWVKDEAESIKKFYQDELVKIDTSSSKERINQAISTMVDKLNSLMIKAGTINAFLHSYIATDSFNKQAARMGSQFDQVMVSIQKVSVLLEAWVGQFKDILPEVFTIGNSAGEHAFPIMEMAEQSQYLMSEKEEILTSELSLSGSRAWGKLQGVVTSQKTVKFELDGETKTLPMPALINLHAHTDEEVRKRAYEAEMDAWESVKEPLAASMNGIKGWVNTLNGRRGRRDALHQPIEQARIGRETLDAMMGAMEDSFPVFRKYFKAKAARFGQEALPWWNVFAPAGALDKEYNFDEARDFILKHFGNFSEELRDFAKYAFEKDWIDAEQRSGKRGGAFCMSVPGVKESRIMCNFDGSLDQVMTIAHELGHGYHNFNMYQADKTPLQRQTPMTMAETASIMCETIVFNAVMDTITDPQEELALLETALIGDSQVIVDIYSRFLFEKEVFERRKKAELSADELCEIMEDAQAKTYGEGLDPEFRHKFMWTWKPHYYSAGLSFYNFPYAFGMLFGIGLYAIYKQRGDAFIQDYKKLLSSTGEAPAAELAARFGIDIRSKKFWEDSLAVIAKRIDRYCEL